MRKKAISRMAVAFVVMLAMPWAVYAQGALSGTVSDETDAVLPGVTVTALHVESGIPTLAVADASGQYRFTSLRVGLYTVTAELLGFTIVRQENMQIGIGQNSVLDFSLSLATVEETITVLATSPLIDTAQSELGGRVDQRQIESLPVLGRNWMALTILAPGMRANDVTEGPNGDSGNNGRRSDPGYYQLNMDGMQVTNTMAGSSFGNIKFARDAIAEFEFQSGRMDATSGRSMGMMLNTVSKAGTNTLTGGVFGYFRHDSMIAEDPVAKRSLPYSNQQTGFNVGGPIRENQLHYFGYYEAEREPATYFWNTPWPTFNIADERAARVEHKFGGRLDNQFTQNQRLMVRISGWKNTLPIDRHNSNSHPSTRVDRVFSNYQTQIGLTQTLGGNKVHELKVYWHYLTSDQQRLCCHASPRIRLRGLTMGPSSSRPLVLLGRTYTVRDDFTLLLGDHELKIGGDFLWNNDFYFWSTGRTGELDARGGPRPSNVEELFPVVDDPSTWNLNPLGPISIRWQQSYGDYTWNNFVPYIGTWFQDNWEVSSNLTLNLGLRWDYAHNWAADQWEILPLRTKTPNDFKNFGPRLGFAYQVYDTTVIRGGWGRYHIGPKDQWSHHSPVNAHLAKATAENPGGQQGVGRADFAINPYNGDTFAPIGAPRPNSPTIEEAFAGRRDTSGYVADMNTFVPYSNQMSIGVNQQLGQTMAFQADYVYTDSQGEQANWNRNTTFDIETGLNRPFSDESTHRWDDWGIATQVYSAVSSAYHALETGFTKRFSDNWQASATYTLSRFTDCDPSPVFGLPTEALDVAWASDLGGECGLARGEQPHRAVFNGIWEAPGSVQLSGLYFYGRGQRLLTSYGPDLRDRGNAYTPNRLRPDGTLVARNDFVGRPIHRVDLRAVRPIRVGPVQLELSVELFNVLNRDNFGAYTTNESSPSFGNPRQTLLVAYVPRTMAVGFAVDF